MVAPSSASSPNSARGLDLGLVAKYSAPAPRYTSYPPATQFLATAAPEEIGRSLEQDNADLGRPLSLYVHLPFCESRCWFCGCNTIITRNHDLADDYLDLLEKEMDLYRAYVPRNRPVVQVHFGGGTPTFLSPAQLKRLGGMLRERFVFAPDTEFSIELDPRRLTEAHVQALAEIGVNRASLGVQDTRMDVQIAINRWQPQACNLTAVAWLRACGISSLNIDLIYGLPRQTPESFGETIAEVLTLQPTRLSVFSYAHVPWIKPAQRIFDKRGGLPGAAEKLAMFGVAHVKLTEAGFVDIGLDHFARPDDELAVALREGALHRNFQGYTTRAGASLYGFGVSAISAPNSGFRQNVKTLSAYRGALTEGRWPVERTYTLTAEDRRRHVVIMAIMCRRGFTFAELDQQLGVDSAAWLADDLLRITDLVDDGLVLLDGIGLTVRPAGEPLLRMIAARFDPYFVQQAQRHASAV